MEEDQVENNDFSIMFQLESVDNVLDAGVASYCVLQYLTNKFPIIPEEAQPTDFLYLLDQIEVQQDFTEKTFEVFFSQCVKAFESEFFEEHLEENEDRLKLTEEFVTNRLSDLQNISKFNFTFTSFLVKEAEIGDISVLKNFTALTNISLKSNLVNDLSSLCELPNLVNLDLSENKVSAIKGINFPSLETFNLNQNTILVIDSISAPKLKSFDLSQNRILFISPNSFDCPKLETLILSQNALKSLRESTFSGLLSLKALKISSNQLKSIRSIASNDLSNLVDLMFLKIRLKVFPD